MNNKRGTETKLYSTTKYCIWLCVLIFGIIAVGLSLYYGNGQWLEISMGLFSGATISLITSFAITVQDNKDDLERNSRTLDILDAIESDLNNADTPNGIRIYQNNKNDGLDTIAMLKKARKRIWILGTDMSNTMIRYGDQIIDACKENPDIEVRLLAMHPQNLFVNTRFGEIGWDNASEMRESVYEAQQGLMEFWSKIKKVCSAPKVDIRLYMSQPTATLFIVDNELVISHLMAGARASDSLQLCCDMDICQELKRDFVDQHFESVWASAIPIDAARCYSERQSVCSLVGTDFAEYAFLGKGESFKRFKRNIFAAAERAAAGFGHHVGSLWVPILFLALGCACWGLIYGGVLFRDNPDMELNGYLTSTALGLISGSILSIIEYGLETWYDSMKNERQEAAQKQEIESIEARLNDVLFGGRANEHGIFVCENRNCADIKAKILGAKKRVWIYATNHRYIGSLEVHRFLKEKAGDLDVRFLMLSPQSLFVSTRFSEIPGKTCAEDFAREISNNLMHLQKEYEAAPRVDVRLYTRQPTFMMYLIDNTLIISHILRQGRARDQAHIIFDLNYPHIKRAADDYIKHFLVVWHEAAKCRKKNAEVSANGELWTIRNDLPIRAKTVGTVDRGDFVQREAVSV